MVEPMLNIVRSWFQSQKLKTFKEKKICQHGTHQVQDWKRGQREEREHRVQREESTERRKGAWGGQSPDSVWLHPGISGIWSLAPVSCVGSRPFLASYSIHLMSVFFTC